MSGLTEEDQLKIAVMKVDLLLKRRQSFWETPRNLALIITAVAAIAGLIGFKLGSQPQTISVNFGQPLTVQMLPGKAP
jgi:hypothetical protein